MKKGCKITENNGVEKKKISIHHEENSGVIVLFDVSRFLAHKC